MKDKAVFLDRDGVLNIDVDYLYKIEDLKWVDGAKEALAYLNHLGYKLFVVTNQSGIARGYYTEQDMHKLHAYMQSELLKAGAKIEKFYYCPHHKDGKIAEFAKVCNCRKPKPGMLLKAMEEFAVDKEHSFLIGDSRRDIEAAEAAGIKGYLFTEKNLLEFVKNIIKG